MTGAKKKKKTFVQKEILDIERNYNFSGATIIRVIGYICTEF